MDIGTTLKHLAPFAIPILALCIPILVVLMRSIERIKRNNNLHATIRQLSEKGVPIPLELINAATIDQTPVKKSWTAASQLRAGVINIAIGLGLMLLFVAMRPEEEWLWVIGAIPTLVGLGFILIWRIEAKS
jgi:hypothetical protein